VPARGCLICVAIGLRPGDEVVLPSLTFAATAASDVHAGGVPVFADVRGLDRPWLSTDAARQAVGPRTRAIINVAYGGHPGELLELRDLAHTTGVTLIEDAAHGPGASASGRQAGTVGTPVQLLCQQEPAAGGRRDDRHR
jgi:dTDP-4-amino-4,6-dideoxygalactose transaminase